MKHFARILFYASVFSLSCFLSVGSAAAIGSCVPSANNLCLQSNQFGVAVDWAGPMESGSGEVLGPKVQDTGFFRFDDADAAEVMVKVLDGCALNNHYWIFMAQVSSHAQDVTVTNFESGVAETYSTSLGQLPSPTLDVNAFVCAEPAERSSESVGLGTSDLFLAEGRFRVSIDWTDFSGGTGTGTGFSITDRSGAFWFFSPENLEMLIKMVPDADSGFFGLSFSGITNVAYNLTFRDTCSGQVRVFSNPLGNSGAATDPMAFPLVCTAQIFADGFESGNLSAWSPRFSSAAADSREAIDSRIKNKDSSTTKLIFQTQDHTYFSSAEGGKRR